MKRHECDHTEQISELMPLLREEDSFWIGLATNLKWSLIDPKDLDLKIKVSNQTDGIFVKVYSEKTGDYAEAVFTALSELATLDLSTPILAPLSLCDNALVFDQGVVVGDELYNNLYSELEQQKIEEILIKHGLNPLSPFLKISVVSIDGKNYAVDPFQDDMSSIFDFVNKE